MSNLSEHNCFADHIVGSISVIDKLGNIYWCQAGNKCIKGFRDAAGYRHWITIKRNNEDTCTVSNSDGKHSFVHPAPFDSINRETLTAIANDLFCLMNKK